MVFDRRKAYGMRLNIPAGTATRFEPGETKTVTLVKIGGNQIIRGGNGIADGPVSDFNVTRIFQAGGMTGFGHSDEPQASEGVTSENSAFTTILSREAYANMYGPTTGDKIWLGDTNLYAQVEMDYAVYGDECVLEVEK